jgi:protein SCO1/2
MKIFLVKCCRRHVGVRLKISLHIIYLLSNICLTRLLFLFLSLSIYTYIYTYIYSAGKPAIGGPWSLVDLEGNLVTDASFKGKWLLLYFGFARCPDICPSEMLKMARVIDKLKETHPDIAKQIVPVFVSVDPARDSLSALKEYAKDFHPDYVFLTGSPTQVEQMAKKYRVYVSKADETEDGDYLVDHSIVVYFHDDKGELSDCFTQSMRPNDISEKIVERMTAVTKVA